MLPRSTQKDFSEGGAEIFSPERVQNRADGAIGVREEMNDVDDDSLKNRRDSHSVQCGEEIEHPEWGPTDQMEKHDALDHLGDLAISG